MIFYLKLRNVFSQNVPPFFFLCNYHGERDQSTLNSGQVSLSINIEGNPQHYEPGKRYQGKNLSMFLQDEEYKRISYGNKIETRADVHMVA